MKLVRSWMVVLLRAKGVKDSVEVQGSDLFAPLKWTGVGGQLVSLSCRFINDARIRMRSEDFV